MSNVPSSIDCVLICAACGYQWDETCETVATYSGPDSPRTMRPSTFWLRCPIC